MFLAVSATLFSLAKSLEAQSTITMSCLDAWKTVAHVCIPENSKVSCGIRVSDLADVFGDRDLVDLDLWGTLEDLVLHWCGLSILCWRWSGGGECLWGARIPLFHSLILAYSSFVSPVSEYVFGKNAWCALI